MENNLEDPATGSAACTLASFLSLQDGAAGQTRSYTIVQGVDMGRRSVITVDVSLDEQRHVSTVQLKGSAVKVMSGHLTVGPDW